MRKLTLEEFIEKSIKIHGDKYDYSITNYTTRRKFVNILCKKHGSFEQLAGNHLNGHGCKICYLKECRDSKEVFIEKAIKIHGDIFNYSKVSYINAMTHVEIICNKHGSFSTTPQIHLKGSNCPMCSTEKRAYTTSEFITIAREIHGDTYDYSQVSYKNNKDKVDIICKKHGIFKQTPSSHISGYKCEKCSRESWNKTTSEFIERCNLVHNDFYDYSKSEYTKRHNKITIICPIHGAFNQNAGSHLQGSGCIRCAELASTSKAETELKNYIKSIYNGEVLETCRDIIYPLELDIYIPKFKIAFEYNGIYWHSNLKKDRNYHHKKTMLCAEKGIRLIQIWEDEWSNNKDKLKVFIQKTLNDEKIHSLYEFSISRVEIKSEIYFINKNHFKGYSESDCCFGLYKNKKLVQIISINKVKDKVYRINKMCSEECFQSKEGYQKLIDVIIKELQPISIDIEVELDKDDSILLTELGFLQESHSFEYTYVSMKERSPFKIKKSYCIFTSGVSIYKLFC